MAEHWVELVISGDMSTVWGLDENKKPFRERPALRKGHYPSPGSPRRSSLSPGDVDSLIGKLPAAATGKTTTVLSLTVSGKTVQARFASAQ